ncbi:putative glycolipid-binding domain-containing protein [Micromonospora sp. NBC_01699]|uniref:putative glycolipid-binding domain-containing protein n=1 Tax=Micromonospora sp. NBC_01699 TaxID=2975984 RepID=UPI002E2B9B27|nr:putative glycolipid-binding domain-containing protein [Micromonospora sp. NBC_01699]
MPMMPRSLLWNRTDVPGADHVLLDDRRGLLARGVALAVDPLPYTCRYELTTDENWAAVRLEVSVEGAGWLRSLRLERAAGRWRASTAEQGDLDGALAVAGAPGAGIPGIEEPDRLVDALDVDLGGAPLFNTLPVRRLGLRNAAPGTVHRITVAWVLVPSLLVVPSEQVYTALAGGNVRFRDDDFEADLGLDADGYVVSYPGLAERVGTEVRR